MKLLLMTIVMLSFQTVFAEVINPSDNFMFTQNGGAPANFTPAEEISMSLVRDGKTILSKSFGAPAVGPMSDLANNYAMIKAALNTGSSVDIGDGSREALNSARKRIESRKLNLDPFTKAYIDNLKGALYNAQNYLEDRVLRLQSCSAPKADLKSPSGGVK